MISHWHWQIALLPARRCVWKSGYPENAFRGDRSFKCQKTEVPGMIRKDEGISQCWIYSVH